MSESKLAWCIKQKKGISLTGIKEHLSASYMNEAEETLENVFHARGKWKAIMAYYACYNAFYSILMRCGIKSEIHDCSIELMILFDFDGSETNLIKKLKEDRIQAQYYLKEVSLANEMSVKKFILKCRTILNDLDSEKIESIRAKVHKIKNETSK